MDTIAIFVLTSIGLGASAVVFAIALVAALVSLGGLFIEVLHGDEASWQRLTALKSTISPLHCCADMCGSRTANRRWNWE
jgi:hypothetical protein